MNNRLYIGETKYSDILFLFPLVRLEGHLGVKSMLFIKLNCGNNLIFTAHQCGCEKVMFSVACVCHSFCPQGGPHVIITRDALDFIVEGPAGSATLLDIRPGTSHLSDIRPGNPFPQPQPQLPSY